MNSTSLIKVQNAEHAIELETSNHLSVGAARAFSLILCEYDEHIANLQGIYYYCLPALQFLGKC